MTEEPLVCTVLPTYNERDNIELLIRGVLASAITPHLVLVVDDNSPDGTGDVVAAVAETLNAPEKTQVHLVRRVGEKGLTSAIQRGIDEAIHTHHAAIVTWMDCDLSMPPEDIPKLIRLIVDEGADLAVGSRWIPGGADIAHGTMARTLSWLINHFAMLLVGRQVHDYTSGFIAGRAAVFEQLRLHGD
ncbi:MAG: glycosyltransferase, partial [Caldilineaceae bacterium]|nr:glycosyltransferase [Caldilineaceae bacterium]